MWGQMFPQISSVFFFLKLEILKLVEKIRFSWLIICLPSKKCRFDLLGHLEFAAFFHFFFLKKKGGVALWKLCALGSCQAFGRCATEASTGQWCWQLVFGSWHWSSATTSTSGEGDLAASAAQFLGRSFCKKCEVYFCNMWAKWPSYMMSSQK